MWAAYVLRAYLWRRRRLRPDCCPCACPCRFGLEAQAQRAMLVLPHRHSRGDKSVLANDMNVAFKELTPPRA